MVEKPASIDAEQAAFSDVLFPMKILDPAKNTLGNLFAAGELGVIPIDHENADGHIEPGAIVDGFFRGCRVGFWLRRRAGRFRRVKPQAGCRGD